MQQNNGSTEPNPDWEISFLAGSDVALGIPGLTHDNIVRQAGYWYRSVTVLKLDMNTAIAGFVRGYEMQDGGFI
jgi:hypothetical protein